MTRGAPHPRRKTTGWDRGFRRALGWLAIGSLTLAALIGLFFIVVRPGWGYETEVLATVALFGLSATLALGCLWAREVSRPGLWRLLMLLLGVAAAWGGWIAALPAFWHNVLFAGFGSYGSWDVIEISARASSAAYACATAATYVGLFMMLRVRSWAARIRILGCIGITIGAASWVAGAAIGDFDEWLMRAMAAGGIVAGASLVIVPLMTTIFPDMRIARNEAGPGEFEVELACPVCAHRQRIPLGRRIQCASCDLGIDLRLDAPTCACGYNFAGLTTTTCPECGEPVPRRHTWALALSPATPPTKPTETAEP